jgi:hypothetical protein
MKYDAEFVVVGSLHVLGSGQRGVAPKTLLKVMMNGFGSLASHMARENATMDPFQQCIHLEGRSIRKGAERCQFKLRTALKWCQLLS